MRNAQYPIPRIHRSDDNPTMLPITRSLLQSTHYTILLQTLPTLHRVSDPVEAATWVQWVQVIIGQMSYLDQRMDHTD